MRLRLSLCGLVLLALGVLTACGGGGSATPTAPARSGAGGAALTLRIDVPLTGTAALRRPAYISPATQSLAIAVLSSTQQTVGTFSVNVTPASPACQTMTVNGIATLVCSLTAPVALPASGTYTLATATYDQPQTQQCALNGTPACAGHVLSASLIATTLQVNAANTVSIVLGGLANAFTVTPVPNGFIQGSVAGLKVFGPTAQSVVVQALDADGYTIAGSGAPTLALSSASPNVQIAAVSPGLFSLHATVTGGLVTPGTISLTAAATPVGNPASPFTQPIPLTIAHTAVFVSSVPTGNVLVFFDGATTPDLTLTNTNQARGVAVDANGTVYVANHGNNTVSECTAASNYATCTVPILGPSGPEGVAIDAAGNLWVAASGSGDILEYPAGQTSVALDIPSGLALLRGVAVDSNGNLWASDQASSHVVGYAPPLMATSPQFATLTTGITTPIQLATDASGNLWVTSSGASTVLQFAPPIVTGNSPAITLATGVSNAQGVAVDATSGVWIANNGGGGTVMNCPPPTGTVTCTSFSVAGALWIAAYPASLGP